MVFMGEGFVSRLFNEVGWLCGVGSRIFVGWSGAQVSGGGFWVVNGGFQGIQRLFIWGLGWILVQVVYKGWVSGGG